MKVFPGPPRCPDTAEVCGCNGVCKGTIVKAIKEQGLFTLEDVRKHTKASASCGSCTGLVEQSSWQPRRRLFGIQQGQTDVRLYRSHPSGSARRDQGHKLLTLADTMKALEWRTPNGCASCRPGINYYLISTWPHESEGRSAIALHQ